MEIWEWFPFIGTMKKFSSQSGPQSGPQSLKKLVSSHEMVAGAAGFEPAAFGFGDRRSTNWATLLRGKTRHELYQIAISLLAESGEKRGKNGEIAELDLASASFWTAWICNPAGTWEYMLAVIEKSECPSNSWTTFMFIPFNPSREGARYHLKTAMILNWIDRILIACLILKTQFNFFNVKALKETSKRGR